jgi:hypothetical protein
VWTFNPPKSLTGEVARRKTISPRNPPPRSLRKRKMGLREPQVGLRKPRAEVIVSTFRQKRLGSSQPIVAARLVLIRAKNKAEATIVSTL